MRPIGNNPQSLPTVPSERAPARTGASRRLEIELETLQITPSRPSTSGHAGTSAGGPVINHGAVITADEGQEGKFLSEDEQKFPSEHYSWRGSHFSESERLSTDGIQPGRHSTGSMQPGRHSYTGEPSRPRGRIDWKDLFPDTNETSKRFESKRNSVEGGRPSYVEHRVNWEDLFPETNETSKRFESKRPSVDEENIWHDSEEEFRNDEPLFIDNLREQDEVFYDSPEHLPGQAEPSPRMAKMRNFAKKYQAEMEAKKEVSAEKQEKMLAFYQAVQEQLKNPDVNKRDFKVALDRLGETLNLNWKEMERGTSTAGKAYPFSSLLPNAVMSWIPSAIGAFAKGNKLTVAKAVAGLQTMVSVSSPVINAVSHLSVVTAMDLMYRTNSKVRPETVGALPLDKATKLLNAAESKLEKLTEIVNKFDENTPLNEREAAGHAMEAAIEDLAFAMNEYGSSAAAAKINQDGQFWQNWTARFPRTMMNGVAAFYSAIARDPKTAFVIQIAGVAATTLSQFFAAQKDGNNKLKQQLVTMMSVMDFRTDEGKQLPPGQEIGPQHMDVKKLAAQFEGPFEARVKLATASFGAEKRHALEEMAGILGVSATEVHAKYFKRNQEFPGVFPLYSTLTLDKKEKLNDLEKSIQGIDEDLTHLKNGDWHRIDPKRLEIVEELMESANESGNNPSEATASKLFPFFPVTFKSPTKLGFTYTARAAFRSGQEKLGLPEEAIPMLAQKLGSYFQMFIGGSSTPQLVSAFLKLYTEMERHKRKDEDWQIPPEIRYPIMTVALSISLAAAFGSAPGINVKNAYRGRLRKDTADGKINIPLGAGKGIASGTWWKRLGHNYWQSMQALPRGWSQDFKGGRAASRGTQRLDKGKATRERLLADIQPDENA